MSPLKTVRTFFFVRHGVTEANKQKLWCGGDWDIDLHEEGRNQAQALADVILELSSDVDKIYCSPMVRAFKTAILLNDKLCKPIEIVEDLREWRVGSLEKTPFPERLLVAPVNTWKDPPEGESIGAFKGRVKAVISYCLEQSESPLVVSHGAFGRLLLDSLGIPERHIENCTLYRVSSTMHDKEIFWQLTKAHE